MRWLTAVFMIVTALPAAAQQPGRDAEPLVTDRPDFTPLVTDRPDFTESTATVPALQLESGYTFARSGDTEEHTLGELLLRVPVARRVELRLGINSLAWTRTPDGNSSGIEDSSLGVKVNLAEGSASRLLRPSVAILAGATLPTGSDAFGEESLQPEATLALAWDLSERIGLASNLGYAYASEGGDRFDEFSGSVALAYALTERLGSYLETFGFASGDDHGPNTSFLNGGLTYLLSADLQLDARIGTGLGAAEADYFVGLGLSRRW